MAQYALALAGWYPDDFELVEAAANLAAEEIQHFRRVVAILNRRSLPTGGRRTNRWVQALSARIEPRQGPWTKVDRLLFGAIVEARSCERFTRLLEIVHESDPEVARHFQRGELERLFSLQFHFKQVKARFRKVGLG